MKAIKKSLIAGSVIYFLLIGFSFALSCDIPGSPLEELENVDVVFSGKVIAIEGDYDSFELKPGSEEWHKIADDEIYFTFEAYRFWKGEPNETVVVTTTVFRYDKFGMGEEYLVYANYEYDANLYSSICGRGGHLNSSYTIENDLKELGKGYAPTTPNRLDRLGSEARSLLEEFAEKYGEPGRVKWRNDTDALEGIWGLNYASGKGPVTTEEEAQDIVKEFFEDTEALWKLKTFDLRPGLTFQYVSDDWRVNYQQYHEDIPIFGAGTGTTITEDGMIYSAEAVIYSNVTTPLTPKITIKQAVETAKIELENARYFLNRPDNDTASLMILPRENNDLTEYHLIWYINLTDYYVDAITGEWGDVYSGVIPAPNGTKEEVLTTTPPPTTTTPEPTVIPVPIEEEKGACGPTIISILSVIPFIIVRRLKRV